MVLKKLQTILSAAWSVYFQQNQKDKSVYFHNRFVQLTCETLTKKIFSFTQTKTSLLPIYNNCHMDVKTFFSLMKFACQSFILTPTGNSWCVCHCDHHPKSNLCEVTMVCKIVGCHSVSNHPLSMSNLMSILIPLDR